jgi:hypothetical protein
MTPGDRGPAARTASRAAARALLVTLASAGLLLLTAAAAHAATITVVNGDGPGEGFNDSTPAAPVGGNPGTSLGAQRLNAFQHAADRWGARIDSPVEIRVAANFNPLTCGASWAVLGSAGPVTVARDFVGAPVAGTWYAIALANALTGVDLAPGQDDISATFNSAIGTTCSFPLTWYYGLDASPPGSQIDFVTVVMHELGHGLGFLTLVDLATGAKLGGLDDAFMRSLEHHTTGVLFPVMTNAQRVSASQSGANLHWVGAHVKSASGTLTGGRVDDHVQMFAPSPAQPGSSVSHFDTALVPNELMEPSYTVPLHTPGLALPLFQDLGWTVAPDGPAMIATPSALAFGSVPVGGKSAVSTVTVRNDGAAAVTVGGVTTGGANADQFRQMAAQDLCSGVTLPPGEECTVGVRFKPTDGGAQTATLVVASAEPDEIVLTVALTGSGAGPEITVSPLAIDFGAVLAGGGIVTRVVKVWNHGTSSLAVGQVTLGGADPGQYKKPAAKDECSGSALGPGQLCKIKVKFKPTQLGPLTATLVIPSSDASESPVTVTLTGTGN